MLYGGHSLRTGGASALAGLGINPYRIQAMGRWNSPLVIKYAGVSMTGELTSETSRAVGTASPVMSRAIAIQDPGVKSTLKKMESQLDMHVDSTRALELRVKTLEETRVKTDKPLVISNNVTGLHHRTVGEVGVQSHAYHTLCGINYTSCKV